VIVFDRLSLNFHFIFVFSQAGNRRVKLCVLTNFIFVIRVLMASNLNMKHENKTDRPKKIKIKIYNAYVLQHSASRIISLEFNISFSTLKIFKNKIYIS
jgi:hypothetical protein